MRSRWIYFLLAVVTAVCVVLGVIGCSDSGSKTADISGAPTKKPVGAPRLLKVSVYMWGEGTGWIGIDFSKNELDAITHWPVDTTGLSASEAEKYEDDKGITFIDAKLTKTEVTALAKLVKDSKLRGFKPQPSHTNERMPNLDECPPSLVINWSDREEVFSLPLSGTVKTSIPKDIQQRYAMMDKIVDEVFTIAHKYRKPPTAKVIPYENSKKPAEYRNYEQERKRLFGN